jgi:oxygen-independent coproporphyrinogen-3 oxidase
VFARIVRQCRQSFLTSEQTEWALETTSSLLRAEDLTRLAEWRFSRLHVGIQTLHDHLRQAIGRRESSREAIVKLKQALGAGFVVSADILYGLPGQGLADFLDTVTELIDLGIHGLSVYRFNVSKRNRRFVNRYQDFVRDAPRDYVFFQAADQLLAAAGYRKNHFAHFARPEDRNLYFTCPQRGEDLLALGPTADGCFGTYRYRHPGYGRYVHDFKNNPDVPALEGGSEETALETRAHPAVIGVMGSRIRRKIHEQLGIESLLGKWAECLLIQKKAGGDMYTLTPGGSWHVNAMIADIFQELAGSENGRLSS